MTKPDAGAVIDQPGTDLAIAQTPDEAMDALRGDMVVAITDPIAVQREIISTILDADNADAILGETNNTISGSDYLDTPFTLNAVRIMRSGKKGGLGVFAVLDATDESGRAVMITSGAGNVMAQAVALWKRDLLPYKVQLVEAAEETSSGFKPQRLAAA